MLTGASDLLVFPPKWWVIKIYYSHKDHSYTRSLLTLFAIGTDTTTPLIEKRMAYVREDVQVHVHDVVYMIVCNVPNCNCCNNWSKVLKWL